MPTDAAVKPWTLRSTLIAVSDLERSVAFYGELGPFHVIAEGDGVGRSRWCPPTSAVLLLRETRSLHQTRHGQQSLGLRSITFNVGSLAELNRISPPYGAKTTSPTVGTSTTAPPSSYGVGIRTTCRWSSSPSTDTVGPEYYRTIVNMIYSMDA